ncbi:NAD(P)H-dependent oxidoreductase [Amycolatopsis sp. NPDC059021]|uniref:NAD(P)H-dependent oxidoreductase n=1 Tax=Amycolatopsis sp. NPDC059021 TaxID=3346704 RepID=UPI00366FA68D
MNVLWISAHPEPRSLNGALRDEGIDTLRALGHEVRESDLYAMNWNPVVDRADYAADPDERFFVGPRSEQAFTEQTLSADIVAEQEKLHWADTVIIQFPLWWYGMPAILKGWFDRVFVKGFGYGTRAADGHVRRYGEGVLEGKRAMVLVTAGGPEATFGPRGVNGDLDELLFGLQHGALWYTGMSVLPPLAVYGANRVSDDHYAQAVAELRDRLKTLDCTEPLPFRAQRSGDYDEDLVLKPEHAPGVTGLRAHLRAHLRAR